MKVIAYLWQLPQNLLGLALWLILRGAIISRTETAGGLVFRCFRTYGGVSLGSYVFVHREAGVELVRHELGHCRQSVLLGPLYLLVIGAPSILWAALHGALVRRNPRLDYFRFYTERWANRIAGLTPARRAEIGDDGATNGSRRTRSDREVEGKGWKRRSSS